MQGSFFLVSFFVRSEGRFFVPTCPGPVTPSAAAVKDGRCSADLTNSAPDRPRLDGGEHGVTLGVVGGGAITSPCPLQRTRCRGRWNKARLPSATLDSRACNSRQSKRLPKQNPTSIIAPLGRLVSSRLTAVSSRLSRYKMIRGELDATLSRPRYGRCGGHSE